MELFQKSLAGNKIFFLFRVPINPYKDWKAKLERPHFFKVQPGKVTVCGISHCKSFFINPFKLLIMIFSTIDSFATFGPMRRLKKTTSTYFQRKFCSGVKKHFAMRYPVYCIRNSTTVKEGNETLDAQIVMIRCKKEFNS